MSNKNPRKRALIFLILLGVILLAGCTGGEECSIHVSQEEGVFIEGFSPSYKEVPVGDIVQVQMIVQNRGTMLAKDVTAELWAHGGFKEPKYNVKELPILRPPDLSTCTSGDRYTLEWSLEAGCDPTNTVLAAVVDYTYNSEGWAEIPLISSAELTKAGGTVNLQGTNKPSAGPIKVEIEAIQTQPIIISGATDTFDIRVLFKNVGNGQVGPQGDGEINNFTLTTHGPCRFINCTSSKLFGSKITQADLGDVQLRIKDQEGMKTTCLKYYGDANELIRDSCTIEVKSTYHYKEYASIDYKMGVYGAPDQMERCRNKPAGRAEVWECKWDKGHTRWYWSSGGKEAYDNRFSDSICSAGYVFDKCETGATNDRCNHNDDSDNVCYCKEAEHETWECEHDNIMGWYWINNEIGEERHQAGEDGPEFFDKDEALCSPGFEFGGCKDVYGEQWYVNGKCNATYSESMCYCVKEGEDLVAALPETTRWECNVGTPGKWERTQGSVWPAEIWDSFYYGDTSCSQEYYNLICYDDNPNAPGIQLVAKDMFPVDGASTGASCDATDADDNDNYCECIPKIPNYQ